MKKTMKSAIAVMMLVSALTAAILASPNMYFGVQNNTTFDLGTVTLFNNLGASTTIEVNTSGSFPIQVQGSVTSVMIYGQLVPRNGQPTNIILPIGQIGVPVQAILTGNQIVIQDQQIVQGDKKPHSR